MKPAQLWSLIKGCFGVDDGSLPEIAIGGLKIGDLRKILSLLLRHVGQEVQVSYWDKVQDTELQANLDESLVDLLAADRATRIKFLLKRLDICDTQLPDLGFLILRDEIVLDYRMGVDWTPETAYGFFFLLKSLYNAATTPSIYVPESFGGGFPEAMKMELEETIMKFVSE